MAKGQTRGNREIRKPKKKVAVATAAGPTKGFLASITKPKKKG